MDCSPPGSPLHGIFQARSTGVCCHFLLQLLTSQSPGKTRDVLCSCVITLYLVKLKKKNFNIYLAVPGLSCGTQDHCCGIQPSLVSGLGIVVLWHVVEPKFPTLEGGFLTTGSPGSPQCISLLVSVWTHDFLFYWMVYNPLLWIFTWGSNSRNKSLKLNPNLVFSFFHTFFSQKESWLEFKFSPFSFLDSVL